MVVLYSVIVYEVINGSVGVLQTLIGQTIRVGSAEFIVNDNVMTCPG